MNLISDQTNLIFSIQKCLLWHILFEEKKPDTLIFVTLKQISVVNKNFHKNELQLYKIHVNMHIKYMTHILSR